MIKATAISKRTQAGRNTRPLVEPSTYLFWSYLSLVGAAELVTSVFSPVAGLVTHLFVMAVLLVHAALGRSAEERKLALALTLAPMIRLLSLAMPLVSFPQIAWYPVVSIPLLTATWIIVRQTGVSRQAMGLRIGNPVLQLMVTGAGLGLGVLEYMILRPKPIVASFDWQSVLIACLSLVIFTGLNEELIFRGLLQATSVAVLQGRGLLFVSLLFGVLHIGYLSVVDVVFVTAVGLLFAYIVRWGGSILGVTLAHGLTNVTLFILMPVLMSQWPDEATMVAILAGLGGALVSLPAILLLWLRFRPQSRKILVPTLDDVQKMVSKSYSSFR
jgi:membrane protease YdiL (CAAX protease family)